MAGLFDDIVEAAPAEGGAFDDIVHGSKPKQKGLLSSVADTFKGAGARMAQGVNESLGGINRSFGLDDSMYKENADYWAKAAEDNGMGDNLTSDIYRGVGSAPAGIAEFVAGVPYAAVKGGVEGYQKDGVEGAATGAALEGVKRLGVGKVFHGIENTGISGLGKAAAMGGTMGAQTAAEEYGQTGEISPRNVAASTVTGAMLSLEGGGKAAEVKKNLMRGGVTADVASDLSSRTMTIADMSARLRKPEVEIPDTGIGDASVDVDTAIKAANDTISGGEVSARFLDPTMIKAVEQRKGAPLAGEGLTPEEEAIVRTANEDRPVIPRDALDDVLANEGDQSLAEEIARLREDKARKIADERRAGITPPAESDAKQPTETAAVKDWWDGGAVPQGQQTASRNDATQPLVWAADAETGKYDFFHPDEVAKGKAIPKNAQTAPLSATDHVPYTKTVYRGVADRDSLHSGGMGRGTYYTSDPDIAKSYAHDFSDKPGHVLTEDIRLERPFYAETVDDVFKAVPESSIPALDDPTLSLNEREKIWQDEVSKRLEAQGYDGIVLRNSLNPRTAEYVRADEVVRFKQPEAKPAEIAPPPEAVTLPPQEVSHADRGEIAPVSDAVPPADTGSGARGVEEGAKVSAPQEPVAKAKPSTTPSLSPQESTAQSLVQGKRKPPQLLKVADSKIGLDKHIFTIETVKKAGVPVEKIRIVKPDGSIVDAGEGVRAAVKRAMAEGRTTPVKFAKEKAAPKETPKAVGPPAPEVVENTVVAPKTPAAVVKKAVVTAKAEGTPLKEQKKYLLENLDDAIKAAPDTLNGKTHDLKHQLIGVRNDIGSLYNKKPSDAKTAEMNRLRAEEDRIRQELRDADSYVTIHVPDDGTFEVYNTKNAIKEFKANVAKLFPAGEAKPSKGYGPAPKPSTVKPEGLEDAVAVKDEQGNDWHTNGHSLVKGKAAIPFKSEMAADRRDMVTRGFGAVVKKFASDAKSGEPVGDTKFVAVGQPIGKGSDNGKFVAVGESPVKANKDEIAYAVLSSEGKDVYVSQKLFLYAKSHHPNAEIRVNGPLEPVNFVEKGKVVAVVMPVKLGSKVQTSVEQFTKGGLSNTLSNQRGSAPMIADLLDSIRQTRTFQDLRSSVHELGAHLYEKGMEFKEFAGRMKEHLSDLWVRGAAFVKGAYEYAKDKLGDERGSFSTKDKEEPGDLTPISDQFRIVRETADKLNKLADRSKFLKGDVKPAINTAIEGTNVAVDGIRRAVNPMKRSPAADAAGRILIEGMGKLAHGTDKFKGDLNRALDQYNEKTGLMAKSLDLLTNSTGLIADKVFAAMPEKDRYDFMQKMDTGEDQATPQLQAIADTVKAMFDAKVEAVQNLHTGALENARDAYFPHIWEKGENAAKKILQGLSKRPLEGSKSFTKSRVFDDVQAGIDAGYKMVSSNPLDIVFLKMAEMDKYINAHTALQEMEDSGLVQLIPAGERKPHDFDEISGPYGIVTKRESADPLTGEVKMKSYRYVARDDVAQIFNNYLSQSLYNNKYIGTAYKGYMGAANLLNQFQLGVFSAFHAGFTSMEAVISHASVGMKAVSRGDFKTAGKYLAEAPAAWYTNPRLGDKIIKAWMGGEAPKEMPQIVQWLELAGARRAMDTRFRTNSTQKLMEKWGDKDYAGAAVRTIPAVVEQSARPIMEWLVPRQKFGVFGEMANEWAQKHPKASHEEMREAMQKIWNRVDSRLGQVVYDRMFLHNVSKNVAQALIRAPGWTGGTILEVGGGIKDLAKWSKDNALGRRGEMSDRAAYTVSMLAVTGLANAMLTAAFTGEGPKDWKDVVAFRTGNLDEQGNPERFMLPTYMKDVYAYASDIQSGDPLRTISHKTHPLLSLVGDLKRNRDYYGVEIRHEGDNPVHQIAQVAGYGLKAFVPFWVRGLQKERDRGGTAMAQAAPFIGVMPAPADMNKSEAEKLAQKLIVERMPNKVKTKEEFERGQLIRKLTNGLRKGEDGASASISEAVKDGKITMRQAHNIRANAKLDPLQSSFKRLGYEEAQKVMEVASDDEKAMLMPLLKKKERNYRLTHPRNREAD